MTINIEITEKPDFALLASLHAMCFKRAWNERDLQELLSIKGTYAFVAEGAFGVLRCIVDEAEILTLTVRPEQRRKGKGEALAIMMRDWSRLQGIKTLFLDVRISNKTAIALYTRAGFSQMAVRKNYYTHSDGRQEAAIVMKIALG